MEDEFITSLKYADDILLIARSLSQIRTMFPDLDPEAAKVGLQIYLHKTKIQHNNIGYCVAAKQQKC